MGEPTAHLGYRVLLLGYKPIQRVTVPNTASNSNTVVSVCVYKRTETQERYSKAMV